MTSQTRSAPEIRGVLFDKDGTLFDFHETWSAWARGFIADVTGGDPARGAALLATSAAAYQIFTRSPGARYMPSPGLTPNAS